MAGPVNRVGAIHSESKWAARHTMLERGTEIQSFVSKTLTLPAPSCDWLELRAAQSPKEPLINPRSWHTALLIRGRQYGREIGARVIEHVARIRSAADR
jgi:hypothetical protein